MGLLCGGKKSTRERNLKNDNDPDLLNAYFASICATDNYVEPTFLDSSPAAIPDNTIEQVYNEMSTKNCKWYRWNSLLGVERKCTFIGRTHSIHIERFPASR